MSHTLDHAATGMQVLIVSMPSWLFLLFGIACTTYVVRQLIDLGSYVLDWYSLQRWRIEHGSVQTDSGVSVQTESNAQSKQ